MSLRWEFRHIAIILFQSQASAHGPAAPGATERGLKLGLKFCLLHERVLKPLLIETIATELLIPILKLWLSEPRGRLALILLL